MSSMYFLDGKDYFAGVIVCSPHYYDNPKVYKRYMGGGNYDPFDMIDIEEAMTYGMPTIVYKMGDLYYDVLHSRFKNDLVYKMGEFNNLGIQLIDVSPLFDWYENWLFSPFLEIILDQSIETKIIDLQNQFPYLLISRKKEEMFYFDLLDEDPIYDYYRAYIIDHFDLEEHGLQKRKELDPK